MQLLLFVIILLQSRGMSALKATSELLIQSSGISADNATFGLTQVLQQLNAAYKVQLNIFVNLKNDSQQTFNFKLLNTNQMQLELTANSSKEFRLLGSFSEKTIIIIYIKNPPIDNLVANLLPRLLWQLHELHIVFITTEEPSAWQEKLYDYCFREGFINVLLVYRESQTISLLSYLPYPKIHIQQFRQLQEYLNRWRQLSNFHRQPIRTISFTVEPRMMRYVNRRGAVVYSGYIYYAFEEFIRRYNATLEFLPGTLKKGDYNYYIRLMQKKEYDFSCHHKELIWNLSATVPLYLVKTYISVPHARPIASYLYFGRPFTWSLWLTVVGCMVYGMLMLYASYRNHSTEIGEQFLSSWCHLLFLSQPLLNIYNWQQFVIHFILMLSGLILTNFYLALLSSMLTSGLFEPQINTLEDLVNSPYPLLLGQYYADLVKQSNILPTAVGNRISIQEPDAVDTARNLLNTSYMYLASADRMELADYVQHLLKVPLFKVINTAVLDGLMAFPVAAGLPYLNMLNNYLRRIFDYGILTKMKSDAWRHTIEAGISKLIRTDGVQPIPFDLQFYYYAFLLWAVGLALAGVGFLLELLRWRMT